MAWFAAHAIIYFKIKDQLQDVYTVWENVYLIEAGDRDEAFAKARVLGAQEEGDDDNSLTVDDLRATRVFAGIRKLIAVSHAEQDGHLRSGDELTYSEFQVSDEASIRRLASDNEVVIKYVE
jgi:hypothetical protein